MICGKLNPRKFDTKILQICPPHRSDVADLFLGHSVYITHTLNLCPSPALFHSNEGNNDSRPINWTTT